MADSTEWGTLETAAQLYGCTENELERWALRGDVYGYFRREGEGWLFPLRTNRVIDVLRLRREEKQVSDSQLRLDTEDRAAAYVW